MRMHRLLWQRAAHLATQARTAWMLRTATERMEVEDFESALALFEQVIGVDAPRETRLLAYHGKIIALLRLGSYRQALVTSEDAVGFLHAWPPESRAEEVDTAREAIEQASGFAQWALAHPSQAAALRDRELESRMEGPEESPTPLPLGRATGWPALRLLYQLSVQCLLAAGLMVQATERGELARTLLRAAGEAARYDRRLERDVYWHLSRLDEQLGHAKQAQASRERYQQLHDEVRQVLRRLRWTN
jgi:tetratricopeptide (TPR) repeat protein